MWTTPCSQHPHFVPSWSRSQEAPLASHPPGAEEGKSREPVPWNASCEGPGPLGHTTCPLWGGSRNPPWSFSAEVWVERGEWLLVILALVGLGQSAHLPLTPRHLRLLDAMGNSLDRCATRGERAASRVLCLPPQAPCSPGLHSKPGSVPSQAGPLDSHMQPLGLTGNQEGAPCQ